MNEIKYFTYRLFVRRSNHIVVQFMRYGIVLLVAAPLDLGGFILLVYLGVDVILAATVAFLVSLAANYVLSITWAFNADPKKKHLFKLSTFLIIGLIGLALTDIIIWVCVHGLGVDKIHSKLVALCIVFFWNFLARRALLSQHR